MNSVLTIRLGSDVLYSKFRYPAGEMQVRLNAEGVRLVCDAEGVRILARIDNDSDIVEMALLADAISGLRGGRAPVGVFPYLPYARADRRFCVGDCLGLQVFGKILCDNFLSGAISLDVHSGAAERFISRLRNVSPMPFIESAIQEFSRHCGTDTVTVLFPDDGARQRYPMDGILGNNHGAVIVDVQHCEKQRDPVTGKLTGFTVPPIFQPAIIIDDICDGGGTFTGISDAIKNQGASPLLGLYVSHGIFSRGLTALRNRFTMIYTTNTIEQVVDSSLTVYDAIPELLRAALAA